ncbi:MAG: ribosomal protein S18-alanine N-acetyltransferase [Syntrophomonadaceae bacterium]|nr:ribosomal protein S18-alanine N-acetyltransferase [Syntrophomonadaceae bacterium]
MELRIREMRRRDLDQILEIEELCFPLPWSRESFLTELKNPLAQYIVAQEGFVLQGYAGVWLIFDEGHITNVAVHPRARGRRIGELLLANIMALASANGAVVVTLEVRPSNDAALSLYRRMGFEEKGHRRGYYLDNGEDALIMVKKL